VKCDETGKHIDKDYLRTGTTIDSGAFHEH